MPCETRAGSDHRKADHGPPEPVAVPGRPQWPGLAMPRPLKAIFGPQNLKCGPQKFMWTPKVPSPTPGAPLWPIGGMGEKPERVPISPVKIQTIFQGICPIYSRGAKRWQMSLGQGSRGSGEGEFYCLTPSATQGCGRFHSKVVHFVEPLNIQIESIAQSLIVKSLVSRGFKYLACGEKNSNLYP